MALPIWRCGRAASIPTSSAPSAPRQSICPDRFSSASAASRWKRTWRRSGCRIPRAGTTGRDRQQSRRRARRGSQICRPPGSRRFTRRMPRVCAFPILGTQRAAVHFALSAMPALADSMDLSAEATSLPRSLFRLRSAPRSGHPAEPPKGDLAVEVGGDDRKSG